MRLGAAVTARATSAQAEGVGTDRQASAPSTAGAAASDARAAPDAGQRATRVARVETTTAPERAAHRQGHDGLGSEHGPERQAHQGGDDDDEHGLDQRLAADPPPRGQVTAGRGVRPVGRVPRRAPPAVLVSTAGRDAAARLLR